MSTKKELATLDHLIRVLGVCQISFDDRTQHDREVLRAAREHVKKECELARKSKEGS
jgi:hypothetical protein